MQFLKMFEECASLESESCGIHFIAWSSFLILKTHACQLHVYVVSSKIRYPYQEPILHTLCRWQPCELHIGLPQEMAAWCFKLCFIHITYYLLHTYFQHYYFTPCITNYNTILDRSSTVILYLLHWTIQTSGWNG